MAQAKDDENLLLALIHPPTQSPQSRHLELYLLCKIERQYVSCNKTCSSFRVWSLLSFLMFTSIIFPMTDYISQPSWQKEYLGQ
jgi:hypothetical protein